MVVTADACRDWFN